MKLEDTVVDSHGRNRRGGGGGRLDQNTYLIPTFSNNKNKKRKWALQQPSHNPWAPKTSPSVCTSCYFCTLSSLSSRLSPSVCSTALSMMTGTGTLSVSKVLLELWLGLGSANYIWKIIIFLSFPWSQNGSVPKFRPMAMSGKDVWTKARQYLSRKLHCPSLLTFPDP